MEDLVNVNDKLAVCHPLFSHKLDIEANKLQHSVCSQHRTSKKPNAHPNLLRLAKTSSSNMVSMIHVCQLKHNHYNNFIRFFES